MQWLRPLYIGTKMKRDWRKAAAAVTGTKPGRYDGCIVLVLSDYARCSVELLPAYSFKIPHFALRKSEKVVGLAKDREEACGLLISMAEDACFRIGKPDLAAYFASLPESEWAEQWEGSEK